MIQDRRTKKIIGMWLVFWLIMPVCAFASSLDIRSSAVMDSIKVSAGSGLAIGETYNVDVGPGGISNHGTLTASPGIISCEGDFHNAGTYTHNYGSVILDGEGQFVYGNSTFYNLIKTTQDADTLTFENDTTQTVENGLTLHGAAESLLSLRSDSDGDRFGLSLSVNGTQALEWLDVKDSDASGGMTLVALNSVDSGNNENWEFPDSTSPGGTEQGAEGTGTGADDTTGADGTCGDEGDTDSSTSSGSTGPDTMTITASDWAPAASIQNLPGRITNATAHRVTIGGIGVVSYRFKVDDGTWSAETRVSDPALFVAEAEGNHTLYVIGKDAEGNVQAMDDATSATWRVDTTPPVATINNYPTGTVGITSTNIIVGGADVQYYRYRMDAGDWSTAFPVTSTIRVSGLADGVHTIDVIGMDTAGNLQHESDATTATWTVDTNLPTALLSGLPDSVTDKTSTCITVGGSNVDEYKYSIDNGATWTQQSALQPVELAWLEEGVYTIYVNAYDTAYDIWQDGALGETKKSATIYTWTVDLTPPVAAEIAANAGAPASTVVELSWPAVEDGLKGYHLWYSGSKIDEEGLEAATELICDITPGPCGHTETFSVRGLSPDTPYYFAVKSVDAAGNFSDISNVALRTTANTLPAIAGFELTGGGHAADNGTARGLRITGTNFVGGLGNNIVRFVSEDADPVFDSTTSGGTGTGIYADVPAGAPVGTYKIRVINKHGISRLSEQAHTVIDAPAGFPEVTGVSPAVGPNDKDTAITITGDNFMAPLEVKLSAADGTAFTLTEVEVVSINEINATVPGSIFDIAEGGYDIQVHTADGCNKVSAARFEAYEPVNLSTATGPATTTRVVDMPDDGMVPVGLTLSTDNRLETYAVNANNVEIEVAFDPDTRIMSADLTPYTGTIDPPRQVPVTREIADRLGPNAVVFRMGSPVEELELGEGQTVFVRIDISMPGSAPEPSIYYLEADGSLTLAGVDGEKGGQGIEQGGTLLATRVDVPEAGWTTYTLGLLLDHMSTFAAGDSTAPGDSTGSDSSGSGSDGGSSGSDGGSSGGSGVHDSGCFIATAAYGSLLEPHVKVLRQFRDIYLLPDSLGHAFVDAYYKYSPPIAGFIAEHDTLRAVVRCALLPVVAASYLFLQIGPAATLALMVAALALMSATGLVIVRGRRPGRRAARQS